MTKKYILSGAALITALSLAACADKQDTETKTTETKTTETKTSETKTTESSVKKDGEAQMPKVNDEEKANEEATTFSGVLNEDAKEAGSSIILSIGDVVGIEDKADIVKSFAESGLIINADSDQLGKDAKFSDFKAGQKVEVKIQGTAPMTRSLPPQLPGSALLDIKKID